MRERPIVVTELDARRLRGLLARQSEVSSRDQVHLEELKSELERARVGAFEETAPGVVTMRSQVSVRDLETDEQSDYTLVFPLEADVSAKRISVLAPLGTALLGFSEGGTVEWVMPGGMRRLRIERVHQPIADDSETPGLVVATGRIAVGAH